MVYHGSSLASRVSTCTDKQKTHLARTSVNKKKHAYNSICQLEADATRVERRNDLRDIIYLFVGLHRDSKSASSSSSFTCLGEPSSCAAEPRPNPPATTMLAAVSGRLLARRLTLVPNAEVEVSARRLHHPSGTIGCIPGCMGEAVPYHSMNRRLKNEKCILAISLHIPWET